METLRQSGILSICDIVLNHTADNSPWLKNHPEASFNEINNPKLKSAILLDECISKFSTDFYKKKIIDEVCNFAPNIENEDQLQKVMKCLSEKIDSLKLHEYFVCNIDNLADELHQFYGDHEKEDFEGKRKSFDEKGWFVSDHYQLVRENFLDQFGVER